jgi:V-type H+-transporting ATPase subunit a
MTIGPALKMTGVTGIIAIVVCFYGWFFLSKFRNYRVPQAPTDVAIAVCILVLMEGTSAMLHSLRLAWVESFSKFAEFAGWAFVPFSFPTLLEESEELKEYLG